MTKEGGRSGGHAVRWLQLRSTTTAVSSFSHTRRMRDSHEEKPKYPSVQCEQSRVPLMSCNSVHACNYPWTRCIDNILGVCGIKVFRLYQNLLLFTCWYDFFSFPLSLGQANYCVQNDYGHDESLFFMVDLVTRSSHCVKHYLQINWLPKYTVSVN